MTQKTIAQRYVLDDKIGSGGMGTVYKSLDTQTEQIVAIKELHPNLADHQLIERFKREGEALRDLNHPNIVKMLDAVEEDGRHYLIMEFISGSDLSDVLQHGQLPVNRILNISIDLADALTRAHRLNIVHRDLKPANILISDDGILRLTDFGVAHVGSKERVTDTDAIVGTIDYLPPEAFDGSQFDERGDIWAFGVILFEMLTGKRPFAGETIMQVMLSITTEPVPDIDELRPDIPVALIDLTYRMLERNVDARIRSVRQIGLELEDILHDRTTQIVQSARFDVSESDIFAIKKHNLPVQSTPFIGREPELDELSKLIIDPSIRLITIIAPGGMGKTRLALEAAERNLVQFDDGVYFVELAPLTHKEQIVPAIGAAIDYKFQPGEGDTQQELLDFLHNKQILLVMDNFEHLLDGADIVGEILTRTNHLQILATSRQRLAQQGENILHLSGMDFPAWQTPADALEYAAVKLFLNSAKRAKPGFELQAGNLDDIARICKLVQGMPLGIVLSGAWLEMLSVKEIAAELAQSMDILSDEVGEFPARQQSIRVVMDYAWQMMTEAEQAVFMKLAVFKGGFTREAAQAVASANLRTLMSLVTKSLIRRDIDSGRYEIHELLRQYAYEKLKASGDIDIAHEQHAIYFSGFVAQQLPLLKGGGQAKSLADIDCDYDNCHAAWLWSVEHNKADLIDGMIDSLYLYFHFHFLLDAGYRLFALARQQWSLSSDNVMPLAVRLSVRFMGTEDPQIVQPILEKSLIIAEKQSHLAEVAFCHRELGRLFGHHNSDKTRILKGLDHFETSLSLCQKLGDAYLEALVLDDIGYAYYRGGDTEKRLEYAGKSLELHKKIGDIIGYSDCVIGYGTILFMRDMSEALKLYEQAREFAYQIGNTYLLNTITSAIGTAYMFIGDFEKAYEAFQTSYRLSLATKNEFLRLCGQLGMVAPLCLMDGDMALAAQYMQDIPEDGALIYNNSFITFYLINSKTLYATRMGDDESLYAGLQNFVDFGKSFGPVITFILYIPLFAYWMGRNRSPEKALQWLSFSHHYQSNISVSLYLNSWSVVVKFRESLRKTLGDEKFEVLWEAGKSLGAQTVFEQINEEFASISWL
jgi:serine/threonine protein kinase/tetratricopeptide (TPR) repeat protein